MNVSLLVSTHALMRASMQQVVGEKKILHSALDLHLINSFLDCALEQYSIQS